MISSASQWLFPEHIRIDDWGYPIIDGSPIPDGLMVHAQRAVRECPLLALSLAPAEP
jgi:ferredoxin